MTELQDLLNEELIQQPSRIVVNQVFEFVKGDVFPQRGQQRATTFGSTKSLLDFYDLVRQAIEHYEIRGGI